MTQSQIVLKDLPGNVEYFVRRCESKVCSPQLRENLIKGIDRGELLVRDIQCVVDHLTDLKQRLEKSDEESTD